MKILYPTHARLLLVALAFATSAGCDTSEQKQVKEPEIRQDQESLAQAKGLSGQLEQLKKENQQLRAANERLELANKDTEARIQQLIAGYGTGIWDYEDDDYPVFVKSMKGAGLKEVVAELNERFQQSKQPKIILKKKKDKRVFVGVDNEEQLGGQMGSNGALSYMTAIMYSLTSVKGIECVYFDIEEGDHAGPAEYCKDTPAPFLPQ